MLRVGVGMTLRERGGGGEMKMKVVEGMKEGEGGGMKGKVWKAGGKGREEG